MSITVQGVVRQLDLVEDHRLRCPVRPQRRTVRMKVHPLRALWFGATGRHPLGTAEFEAAVADRDHFDQHAVVLVRFQAVDGQAHRGEHAPVEGERRMKGGRVRVAGL